jgi:hypothetical protein
LGAHIFYTIGNPPDDPTHTGDTPTGTTRRFGSNSGIDNSGAGGNFFKALSYQAGSTDSDIGVSAPFGTVGPPGDQPILSGGFNLLPSDPDRNGNRLLASDVTDEGQYPTWNYSYCDGFRYRGTWGVLEPTQGAYDWLNPGNVIDALLDKALAKGKFVSLNISAGKFTPRWVFDSAGATEYFVHDTSAQADQAFVDGVYNGTTTITSATARFKSPYDVGKSITGTGIPGSTTIASVTNATTAVLSNAASISGSGNKFTIVARQGTQPIPWDPTYQTNYFAFIDAFAAHIAGRASGTQVRAIIDCGFSLEASMELGDSIDKSGGVTGYGMFLSPYPTFGYPDLPSAYQAAGLAILNKWYNTFPHIGHILTFTTRIFGVSDGLSNTLRTAWLATNPNRKGDINTSLRATYAPGGHGPGNPGAAPSCAQQVFAMTNATDIGGAHPYTGFYSTNPPPPPTFAQCGTLGGALGVLQDCGWHAWDVGNNYEEIYTPDWTAPGTAPILTDLQAKLKSNLTP